MAEVRLVDETLFGQTDAFPRSAGEFHIGREFLLGWDQMRHRSEWCMENLPYTDTLLLEDEDQRLLRECMSAFIYGLFCTSIISADAFLERIITDAVETNGERSGRFGFGRTLKKFGNLKIVDDFIFRQIQKLHDIRNNLAHEKGPEDHMRIFRRALARRIHTDQLLAQDAKEALCLAYGLASTLTRNFPRLAIPGVGTPKVHRTRYK